jgi:transcription initiation factor TFIIIB Brf1 subunit/transcription initiation factor TFIIB
MLEYSFPFNQKDIAQAANITEVPIRNRIRDLKKFSSTSQ